VSIQQTQDLCNYKCIKVRGGGACPQKWWIKQFNSTSLVWLCLVQLKKTMSGSALISLAQEKHCLQGVNPSNYALYQVLSDKREYTWNFCWVFSPKSWGMQWDLTRGLL